MLKNLAMAILFFISVSHLALDVTVELKYWKWFICLQNNEIRCAPVEGKAMRNEWTKLYLKGLRFGHTCTSNILPGSKHFTPQWHICHGTTLTLYTKHVYMLFRGNYHAIAVLWARDHALGLIIPIYWAFDPAVDILETSLWDVEFYKHTSVVDPFRRQWEITEIIHCQENIANKSQHKLGLIVTFFKEYGINFLTMH